MLKFPFKKPTFEYHEHCRPIMLRDDPTCNNNHRWQLIVKSVEQNTTIVHDIWHRSDIAMVYEWWLSSAHILLTKSTSSSLGNSRGVLNTRGWQQETVLIWTQTEKSTFYHT